MSQIERDARVELARLKRQLAQAGSEVREILERLHLTQLQRVALLGALKRTSAHLNELESQVGLSDDGREALKAAQVAILNGEPLSTGQRRASIPAARTLQDARLK